MKILKAEITGFGKWQNKTFEFSDGNQLFFGLNEEGKSTIYQFISAVLFGFPARSKKSQDFTPKDGGSFGGKLWIDVPAYGTLVIERLKNKNKGKASVLYGETVMNEDFLAVALDPLTEDIFHKVFTLNQEQLTQLTRLQENELHEALISLGVSGSADLFQKRQEYAVEAQKIYRRRGTKQPLNQKLKEWQALKTEIRQKADEEASFSGLTHQQDQLEGEMADIRTSISESEKVLETYRQQTISWPQYEEWNKLSRQTGTEVLEADSKEVAELYPQYQQVEKRIEELRTERKVEEDKKTHPSIYYFFLEHEEKIRGLEDRETDIIKSQERLDQQYLKAEEKRFKDLGERWGWQAEPALAPVMLTDEERRKYIDGCIALEKEKNQLEIKLELASEQRDILSQDLSAFEGRNSNFPRRKDRRKSAVPYFLFGTAGLFLIGGITFAKVRAVLLILSIISGISGAFILMAGRPSISKKKRKWQQKLVYLDNQQEKVEDIRRQLADANEKLEAYEADFQLLKEENHLGDLVYLDNLKDALNDLEHYLFYLEEQASSETIKAEAAETLKNFEEDIQFLAPWLPLQDKDYEGQFREIKRFIQHMEEIERQQKNHQLILVQKELLRNQVLQRDLLEKLKPIMEKYKLTFPSELGIVLEKAEEQEKMQRRRQDLEAMVKQVYPEAITKEALDQAISEEKEKRHQLQEQFEKKMADEKRIQVKAEAMQKSGRLDSLYREEERLKAEISSLALSYGTFQLADNILGDLSTELSQQQLPQLLEKAGKYFSILTAEKYDELIFSDNILYASAQSKRYSIYECSTGTRDQIIMALRFAFLSLEKQRQLSPVIIDDGWLHYDYKRKRQLAQLLMEFGKEHQIICFSSDREMVSYYKEINQPAVLLGGEE